MSNIPEPVATFSPVYQLEVTDKALAGPDGVMNAQAAQLMARDNYLAQQFALAIPAPASPVDGTSVYFNGTVWAAYTVTAVGRTLLAATTQAAQRTALGAVGLTGDETVNGIKTWNSPATWVLSSTGSIIYGQPGGDSTGITLLFGATGSVRRTDIRARASDVLVGCSSVSDGSAPTRFLSVADFAIRPTVTNVMSCGTAVALWTTVFATNSTISTSDARLKTEPRQLKDAEFKAFSAVCRLPPVWRWLSRVHGDENFEAEGQAARKHFGPTVQAAMKVFADNGLKAFENAPFCYDEWEAEPATYDDEGNVLTPAREPGDRYSFRKEELLCGMVSALAREIDEKDARIEAQQTRLNDLTARVEALEAK
ncbi:tail fiber domain-containing protein [Stenotrophomonas maltophilia]|uniref:tail fiber domain-containing protein n=1 Tax=Stenotrophomonas maltophilia TaxID=40324 RepID=UPI003CEE07DC